MVSHSLGEPLKSLRGSISLASGFGRSGGGLPRTLPADAQP